MLDSEVDSTLKPFFHYILPLTLGTDDHLIITAANDLLMEQQYFLGGQFMAHIARHGQHVIAGLSDFTKGRIRGATTDNRFGMEDIPSYDIQVLLRKVKINIIEVLILQLYPSLISHYFIF